MSNTRNIASYIPHKKRHTVRTRAEKAGVPMLSKRRLMPPLADLPPGLAKIPKQSASSLRRPKKLKEADRCADRPLRRASTAAPTDSPTAAATDAPTDVPTDRCRDDIDIKDLNDILQSKEWSSLPTYFERFDDTQIQLLCDALYLRKLKKRTRDDQVRGLTRQVSFLMESKGARLAERVFRHLTLYLSGGVAIDIISKKKVELDTGSVALLASLMYCKFLQKYTNNNLQQVPRILKQTIKTFKERKHPGSTPTARSPKNIRTIKNPSSAEVKTWTTWAHDPKQKRNPVACAIRNKKTSGMLAALTIALLAHTYKSPIAQSPELDNSLEYAFKHPELNSLAYKVYTTCGECGRKDRTVLLCHRIFKKKTNRETKTETYACSLCEGCVNNIHNKDGIFENKRHISYAALDKSGEYSLGHQYKYYYTLNMWPFDNNTQPTLPWGKRRPDND